MSDARPALRESLIARLAARDRALFIRWAVGPAASGIERRLWTAVTHIGGVWCSILVAVLPFFIENAMGEVRSRALATLVGSHLLVQLVKRTVGRPRPSHGVSCEALVAEPDRFSFPSGHSAAAMSVACVYAFAFPALAAPLLVLATVVGISRVCLGVHYPGDVLVGQLIALGTGAIVLAF